MHKPARAYTSAHTYAHTFTHQQLHQPLVFGVGEELFAHDPIPIGFGKFVVDLHCIHVILEGIKTNINAKPLNLKSQLFSQG